MVFLVGMVVIFVEEIGSLVEFVQLMDIVVAFGVMSFGVATFVRVMVTLLTLVALLPLIVVSSVIVLRFFAITWNDLLLVLYWEKI